MPQQHPSKSAHRAGRSTALSSSGGLYLDHNHDRQPSRRPTRRAQRQRAHHSPCCCCSSSSDSCCRCTFVAARRSASRSRIRACSSACSSTQAALLSCCCPCCCCPCCCCACCAVPPAAAARLARHAASRAARSDLQSGSRTTLRKSADSGPSSWLRCQRHSARVGLGGRLVQQKADQQTMAERHRQRGLCTMLLQTPRSAWAAIQL